MKSDIYIYTIRIRIIESQKHGRIIQIIKISFYHFENSKYLGITRIFNASIILHFINNGFKIFAKLC